MQNQVRDAILENHMLAKGDRCIVAVSGGADSVGLLHVLIRLNKLFNVKYRVVHVHHGLRGAEADRDAEFVRDVCGRHGIPCRVVRVNVRDFSVRHKLSTEEAARYLRYKALEQSARLWERENDSQGQVKIAVAHNKQDNAETILMQLARGSGLKGVAGMAPVRGRIIRPLLQVGREEIEAYLMKEGESWVLDSTNAEEHYTRNRMRHYVLPLFIEEINEGAIDNINRAGKLIGQADSYISGVAREQLESMAVRWESGYEIPVDRFLEQDPVIRTYMIRMLLEMVNETIKNITSRHIEGIDSLAFSESGKGIDLPYGMTAERVYDKLRIYKKNFRSKAEREEHPRLSGHFSMKMIPYSGERVEDLEYTKWFDYDKIEGPVDIRFRQRGDSLELRGVGTKLLRAYMTDAKIPQDERDTIPVVATGKNVLWLVGYRISERYKVDRNTRTVLEIKFEKEE